MTTAAMNRMQRSRIAAYRVCALRMLIRARRSDVGLARRHGRPVSRVATGFYRATRSHTARIAPFRRPLKSRDSLPIRREARGRGTSKGKVLPGLLHAQLASKATSSV